MPEFIQRRAEFENLLKASLALDCPYHPGRAIDDDFPDASARRPAAVLVLFALNESGQTHLLLIRRAMTLGSHQGQIAFPGGSAEDASTARTGGAQEKTKAFKETALRETKEEVGIPSEKIQIFGTLPPLGTLSSNFWVHPFVAMLTPMISQCRLTLNSAETDLAFWVPFSEFFNPAIYSFKMLCFGKKHFPVHSFQIGEHRVWGATGAMIRNLVERFKHITSSQ